MDKVIEFFSKNWSNLLLIFVGMSAFIVYIQQEHNKKRDAAILIIQQINEVQKKIEDMSTFISDSSINQIAFYESLPILQYNYWEQYKHYFVEKMTVSGYETINNFYKYVEEISEQQNLIKSIQNDLFQNNQNRIADIEKEFIYSDIRMLLDKAETENSDIKYDDFVNVYSTQKNFINDIFVKSMPFSPYVPVQINSSLNKTIKSYNALQVKGSSGYELLRKKAGRKIG